MKLKYSSNILYCFILILYTDGIISAKDYYSPELLRTGTIGNSQLVNEDISIFEDNDIASGTYDVNIFINNNKVDFRPVDFILNKHGILMPCLSISMLNEYGVIIPSEKGNFIQESSCLYLNDISYARYNFDINKKLLNLTFPQSYINESEIYELQSKYWDDGITAGILNYSFSGANSNNNGSNYYSNIRSGFNLGAWRYRNYSTWSKSRNSTSKWNTINNTLSRNITKIKSELTIGNIYTSSAIFDTVKIKGLKLSSDERMLPNFMQSYAPNIIGITNSESTITIEQNNNIIYQNSVPAGPFDIKDYYPIANGGNLYVTIKEADGSERKMIIPYSSIMNLERKGQFKYSVSTGKYDGGKNDNAYYNQLEGFYGINEYWTLHGGTQLSSNYTSVGIGSAFNMGVIGALSADLIHSSSEINNKKKLNGDSFKINYAKNIPSTETNISMIGIRHFDETYLSFTDAMEYDDRYNNIEKVKTESNISLSQRLFDDLGSLNFTVAIKQYNDNKKTKSYNLGYTNNYNDIVYGIYFDYFNHKGEQDNTYNVNFNISIPFLVGDHNIWSSYGLSTNSDHQTTHTARLYGSYDNNIDWSAYQGYTDKHNVYNSGISGTYKSQYANVNSGYSYTKNNKNINYGLSGSILVSNEGIVLSQPLQETNALIKVNDAQGVEIINSQSSITNGSGLTVFSGLSPYRKNTISLNMQTIPDDIDIDNNIVSNVIPTRGAIILADFKATKGYKLFITINNNGNHIPVGAEARLENGEKFSIANFNKLYLTTENDIGKILVNWKIRNEFKSCIINYNINNSLPVNGLYLLESNCE